MTLEVRKCVAENLISLRKSQSLRQEHVAQALQISRSSYSQFEEGARLPDTKSMCALSRFYQVSIDTLMKRNMREVLTEHFLHCTYSKAELDILRIFNSLTDFSKGQLMEHAQRLATSESKEGRESFSVFP